MVGTPLIPCEWHVTQTNTLQVVQISLFILLSDDQLPLKDVKILCCKRGYATELPRWRSLGHRH